ncbi:MAG TPA: tetratricopeptide repeat protein [Gemmataceae bacterium]|nr:tetratricopeptide repeat protein [Gemmataceae bacterium]
MDCRGSLGLALCLLSGAAGCQHQVTSLSPTSATPVPKQEAPDPSQIKKASSLPPKEPPPAVLVSWGDFKAGEAFAPEIPPGRQQQIRDAARQDYERALKTDPKNVPAYQGLARLDTAMRNHTHAIQTYQTALQMAPKNAALWYELGMSHNALRNWEPALNCLNQAVQLDPGNRYYSNTLGIVLAQTGRYQESLQCFARANGEAMGYLRLAQTLERLQQPELSRQYMEVALQKDPKLASTLISHSDKKAPSTPSIQRTSYQAPSVPPSPPTSAAPVGYPGPMPRIIHLDAVETKVPAEPMPAAHPFVIPPPPTVTLNYPEEPSSK